MDALRLLKADHDRVRGLFKRFRTAEEAGNADEMGVLSGIILRELDIHATIEEEVFYPAARDTGGEAADAVAEGVEEHHVVKQLMTEIEAETPGGETYVAKMKVLMENVEHHAEEEESEMFPKVRSGLGSDRLETLGEELDAAKSRLGAPTLADKIDLPKTELERLAREQEIPGRSTMSQEELAATVAPE